MNLLRPLSSQSSMRTTAKPSQSSALENARCLLERENAALRLRLEQRQRAALNDPALARVAFQLGEPR